MVPVVSGSEQARAVLAAAYGVASGEAGGDGHPVVGTEHLLIGLVSAAPTRDMLAGARLTRLVVWEAFRRRLLGSEPWHSEDRAPATDGRPMDASLTSYRPGRKPMDYTGAARAAMQHAAATATARGRDTVDGPDVLAGVLAAEDDAAEDSRALELVRACGADPAQLRRALPGGGGLAGDDGLPAQLWFTRAGLLGQARYRPTSLSARLTAGVLRLSAGNLARTPWLWVDLDAAEQARRLGARRVRTEHLLLAVLALHETLERYPHMRPLDLPGAYAGGAALADFGLSYLAVRDVARRHGAALGRDARPAARYVRGLRRRGAAGGTGHLLVALVTNGPTRAAALLRMFAFDPEQCLQTRPIMQLLAPESHTD